MFVIWLFFKYLKYFIKPFFFLKAVIGDADKNLVLVLNCIYIYYAADLEMII